MRLRVTCKTNALEGPWKGGVDAVGRLGTGVGSESSEHNQQKACFQAVHCMPKP